MKKLNITVVGLTITSSWGNGHATTYRALLKELAALGHKIRFLEKNTPWYQLHRDLPRPGYCEAGLYENMQHITRQYASWLEEADLVIIGSYVSETAPLTEWLMSHTNALLAFYDIDTPVTMAKLEQHDYEYLTPSVIPAFDLYFSFSGGPVPDRIAALYGAPCVRPLYCSVDTSLYYPEDAIPAGHEASPRLDLGYLGTYSRDRQDSLDELLLRPARLWQTGRFMVAGALYPADICWPSNVYRVEHLPPSEHRRFYNSQRFTLNVTRQPMIGAGYSPSVRLFEAAACGVPVISDYWAGIEEFFEPGSEILIAESGAQVLDYLRKMDEEKRRDIARRAREKVLKAHSAATRAGELLGYVSELMDDYLQVNSAHERSN
ncbi:MAG: glycosyltransferase [Cytophagaceae bacterium SCN 52-12]|nr:MAG: glycosyltransferase [Cytophagaceae bacterium SCN 52-12]